MKAVVVLAAVTLTAGLAQAQHRHYAGQQDREIKALSAEEMQQYRAGAGMGHAKAAELNRFPGPMHVLELGEQLGLSQAQRTATKALMETHKREAREIGARLVEAERALDALFQKGDVSAEALDRAVRHAATLQGEYRLSHLETHRRMRALLSEEQIERYHKLRGY